MEVSCDEEGDTVQSIITTKAISPEWWHGNHKTVPTRTQVLIHRKGRNLPGLATPSKFPSVERPLLNSECVKLLRSNSFFFILQVDGNKSSRCCGCK